MLDLVPGHTSDQHPWFLESKKAKESEYTNRYIFTKSVWDAPPEYRMMCGLCERDGNYMVNYFSSQPALNYGFYEVTHPEWQLPYDHPDALATAEAIKDVMRFWLDKGADGFRVDMADSLVKNDDEKIATAKIWRGVREMLDKDYPEAAMVSEWCNPERAINNAVSIWTFTLTITAMVIAVCLDMKKMVKTKHSSIRTVRAILLPLWMSMFLTMKKLRLTVILAL